VANRLHRVNRCILVGTIQVTFVVSAAVLPHAQSATSAKFPVKGSISGRVLAVTNAGDLKPARFATVYLISGKGNRDHKSATLAYLQRSIELMQPGAPTCYSAILNATKSISAAVQWGEENNFPSAVQMTKTDEEGNFRLSGIRLDSATGNSVESMNLRTHAKSIAWEWAYKVVVLGRAGANDAYWEASVQFNEVRGRFYWRVEAEDLASGKDILMKMPAPREACLNLRD
jgi:hypothetical protein